VYLILTFLVDLEAYPDYLGIVGGEDKMMDLGTIQGKIDNEEYRSIDEFQVSHY
jgi:bromodomain-containing protein 7/9